MLRYNLYSREEMIGFAKDRQLRLSLSKALFCRPTRESLIQALKQADADWTFRFLDLPTELRVWIYKELLVLRNSHSCHPAILATCRQISQEATNILYGDNIVHIKICYSGVLAQGKYCPPHEPRVDIYVPREQNTKSLVWPDYLRRVQSLKIEYSSWRSPLFNDTPRLSVVHNILHSLGGFLLNNHQLRSVDVDLSKLATTFASKELLLDFEQNISSAIYPLRLLGSLKHLRNEGLPPRLSNVLEPTPPTLKLADEILDKPIWTVIKHNHAAVTTRYELEAIASVSDRPGNINPMPKAGLFLLQTIGVGHTVLLLPALLTHCTKARGLLVGQFRRHVEEIRQQWEIARPAHVTGALMKRIDALVGLDVDLVVTLSKRQGR